MRRSVINYGRILAAESSAGAVGVYQACYLHHQPPPRHALGPRAAFRAYKDAVLEGGTLAAGQDTKRVGLTPGAMARQEANFPFGSSGRAVAAANLKTPAGPRNGDDSSAPQCEPFLCL